MAVKYPFDEFTTVIWIPGDDGVTNIAAPTTGEIAAGTDITCDLTKDGLNPGGTTNAVEAGALCNRVDSRIAGSVAYDFTLRGFRYQPPDDDFWALAEWGNAGFLVVRRGVLYGTAFADGDAVENYKSQMGEPVPAASAANTMQTFELGLFIDQAELKAVVDAGS